MYPKSKSKSKSKRYSKHSKHSKTSKRGGRNAIVSPKIRYSTNVSNDHTLSCTKCGKGTFTVKTLTMGTKLKTLLGFQILDNRFKVFTCNTCGFAQLYSNNITCNGKQCDPLVKV
jgi:predicted nucleic-acid-binding Zn-ribbon protein